MNVSVTVVGISSDRDPRLSKAMTIECCSGTNNPKLVTLDDNVTVFSGFHAKLINDINYIQDPAHSVAKLRARLLALSFVMPMGYFMLPIDHIKTLMQTVSKDKYGINEKDVSIKDNMNFDAVMRICDPKVWLLLEEHIHASEGTKAYLKVM